MGLRPMEKDLLTEISNISMGSAATALSSLLNKVVRVPQPDLSETTTAGWQEHYDESGFLARIIFEGGLTGFNYIFFPDEDAALLASLMMGLEKSPLQAVEIPEEGAVNEALSIIMGTYSTSLGNFISLDLELGPIQAEHINPSKKDFTTLEITETDEWVGLSFHLEIEPDKQINLIQLIPVNFLHAILNPLLAGMGIDIDDDASEAGEDLHPLLDDFLNEMEKDAIAEVGNISMGASATALSQLVEKLVQITTPHLSLATIETLQKQYPLNSIFVRVNYREGLKGESILILKEEDAALIAALMMGLTPEEASPQIGEMELSAVSEAMNQMMGSSSTAMSDFLNFIVDISPPTVSNINLQAEELQISQVSPGDPFLQISFQMEIGDLLQSRIVNLLPFPFAKEIASSLLQEMMSEETSGEGIAAGDHEDSLSDMQKDALAEMGNISLGFSATALSELISRKVNISAPRVTITNMKEISAKYPIPCLIVMVHYIKGIDGNNVLIVREDDALVIVGLMLGMTPPERPQELGEIEMSAISEAMNQMMGSASTAMSDLLERIIDISPPTLTSKDSHLDSFSIEAYGEDAPLVQVSFRMEVEGLIDSEIFQLIPLDFAMEITSYLLSTVEGEEAPQAVKAPEPASAPAPVPQKKEEVFLTARTDQLQAQPQVFSPAEDIASQLGNDEYAKLNLIRDIPLEIQAVLGKARVPLKRIFSLLPGEIVSLNRFLGEPVELFAHEHLVATGEVVMVNGQFGIKVTGIVRTR